MGAGTVTAAITISVDGYFVGPDDTPDRGLGRGGERLHYWVFGGPWTYDAEPESGGPAGADADYMNDALSRAGAVICGRTIYENAGKWGGSNPFPVPLFIVTHRVEDQPPAETGFQFVPDLTTALDRAREAAGDGEIQLGGGGSIIHQAIDAGVLDELYLSTAPVVLGGGKRLFEGLQGVVDLEKVKVWDGPLATHVHYRIRR